MTKERDDERASAPGVNFGRTPTAQEIELRVVLKALNDQIDDTQGKLDGLQMDRVRLYRLLADVLEERINLQGSKSSTKNRGGEKSTKEPTKKPTKKTEAILAYLRKSPSKARRVRDILEALGLPDSQDQIIRSTCHHMVKDERLKKVKKGYFQIGLKA